MAVNENVVKFIHKIGPELLPNPQVDGKITSGLFKLIGQGQIGLKYLADGDPKQLSQPALETFYGHFPAGTSFRCVNHFKQCIVSKNFQSYDFGVEENLARYGQQQPPILDVNKIKDFPIALFGGETDMLSSPQDFRWLRDQLHKTQSCVYYKEFPFGHLAFLFPPTIKYFYELFQLIKHYDPSYAKLEVQH